MYQDMHSSSAGQKVHKKCYGHYAGESSSPDGKKPALLGWVFEIAPIISVFGVIFFFYHTASEFLRSRVIEDHLPSAAPVASTPSQSRQSEPSQSPPRSSPSTRSTAQSGRRPPRISPQQTTIPASQLGFWKVGTVTDKITGEQSPRAVLYVRSDDDHYFKLTSTCDRAIVAIAILALDKDVKFKSEETANGQNLVFVTRTRLDEGETRVAQSSFSYNNEATIAFLDPEAASQEVGQAYAKVVSRAGGSQDDAQAKIAGAMGQLVGVLAEPTLALMSAGTPDELRAASTLRMEPALDDGAQPLITADVSGGFRVFLNACSAPSH